PAKPDRKGARATFGAAISALANVSFSTESAVSGPSLHVRTINCFTRKRTFRQGHAAEPGYDLHGAGAEPSLREKKSDLFRWVGHLREALVDKNC
ncbi:hypothetical protein, partial [Maritimibacter harenae]|uniref:hypothetical protein n=1 Tax=Maritimibacter harenae TaxID=2606218 RepID=UPI001F1E0F07